jgi:hypothetical protein
MKAAEKASQPGEGSKLGHDLGAPVRGVTGLFNGLSNNPGAASVGLLLVVAGGTGTVLAGRSLIRAYSRRNTPRR